LPVVEEVEATNGLSAFGCGFVCVGSKGEGFIYDDSEICEGPTWLDDCAINVEGRVGGGWFCSVLASDWEHEEEVGFGGGVSEAKECATLDLKGGALFQGADVVPDTGSGLDQGDVIHVGGEGGAGSSLVCLEHRLGVY
jgi:hypothetical protein